MPETASFGGMVVRSYQPVGQVGLRWSVGGIAPFIEDQVKPGPEGVSSGTGHSRGSG